MRKMAKLVHTFSKAGVIGVRIFHTQRSSERLHFIMTALRPTSFANN